MSNQLQRKLLELAGDSATILKTHQSEWKATTFEGVRHKITMQFTNADHANAFMSSVGWHGEDLIPLTDGTKLCELTINDDVIIDAGHVTIVVEALTLKG